MIRYQKTYFYRCRLVPRSMGAGRWLLGSGSASCFPRESSLCWLWSSSASAQRIATPLPFWGTESRRWKMSDRERRSIDPITAELCVWTCCFKNKIVNHLFPFILFSLTSTYMHYRNLSKERERKRNFTSLFNCDPQYSAYKTRYLLWWCLIWIILYIRCFS